MSRNCTVHTDNLLLEGSAFALCQLKGEVVAGSSLPSVHNWPNAESTATAPAY